VAIARSEKDPELKKTAVSKLTLMNSRKHRLLDGTAAKVRGGTMREERTVSALERY